MYSFFVEPSDIREENVYITGSDVNHISHVLRMKTGEQIRISDRQGQEYICELKRIGKECIEARILEAAGRDVELPSRIVLFQGLPKGDKMELIIQKATELGVAQIVPVRTKRTIVKLDQKKEANRLRRWNTIALSAAKQSGRSRVPEVTPVNNWEQALEQAEALDHVLVPYELAEDMQTTRQCIEQIKKDNLSGYLLARKVGLMKPRLLRPWRAEWFRSRLADVF